MLKRFSLVFLLLFAAAAVLNAADESGKVTRDAAVSTVKGTLVDDGFEWYLKSGKELYQLHFGNRAYLAWTGIPLFDARELSVAGNVVGDDIIVYSATLEGKDYTFRDKNGVPLWVGGGRGFGPGPNGCPGGGMGYRGDRDWGDGYGPGGGPGGYGPDSPRGSYGRCGR